MTVARLTDTALGGLGVPERQADLAVIQGTLDAADAGQGGLLVVQGPAGIGKTALLQLAATIGRARGNTVLAARGSPLERDYSFGVVQQLLAPLRLGSLTADSELLDGAAALALRALGHSPGHAIANADTTYATLHGLYWLVANLSAQAQVLLLVDDCHWADAPSLRFLAFLGARRDGLRIVTVTAQRTGDPAAEPELLRELAGLADTAVFPALLGRTATASLVRGAIGDRATDRFCAACHTATGGNPLLIRTLVSALSSDGIAPTVARQGDGTTVSPM